MSWTPNECDYPIEHNSGDDSAALEISTVDELLDWMDRRIQSYENELGDFEESTEFKGRAYVARTIKYHSEEGLIQTGSAPSYFGDLWTLATCKKYMRGEPRKGTAPNSRHPFRQFFSQTSENVLRPKKPLFILTFSSKDSAYDKPGDEYQRALASVALVTHGFNEMGDYADYLRRNITGESIDKRLSHGGDEVAEERGDCHADREGNVHYPPADHQHGDGSSPCGCSSPKNPEEHIDNSPHHVKCLSRIEYWIAWNEPTLAMDRENEFGRAHKNISSAKDVRSLIGPVE